MAASQVPGLLAFSTNKNICNKQRNFRTLLIGMGKLVHDDTILLLKWKACFLPALQMVLQVNLIDFSWKVN